MFRLFNFAFIGLLAYAIVTATPAQQSEMLEGGIAMKEAVADACLREDGLCTSVIAHLKSAVDGDVQGTQHP
jgi:hypothetical protein